MKFIWLFALLLFCSLTVTGQSKRPSIGLTLSGGGAKGLAHIGILKAIDSAGLKIDYITGTSMGSIMGALYAVGYTGKQIEGIARSIDWVNIFSNRPPLELVNMNEKKEFSNYAIEIPIEKGKAKFYSGLIEGEEIWLKFGELFYPVHNIKDFSKFSIPFRCVATDAATGRAVVLKDGEIVRAIRSSMSIPSIFSAVTYNNTKLVDGGVVRNFPVRDAKEMGADYVIGVNLSQGLLPAERLQSPIDIIYQIGFYKDADDFLHEKNLCNLLIEPPLDNFSPASFGAIDSLLLIGNQSGNHYYPYFKKLADSLKALYPDAKPAINRLPISSKVIIDEIVADGISREETRKDFNGKLGLMLGKAYSGKEIAQAARKAFSSDNFRRIAFFVEPLQPGHARLRCEVIEDLPTYLKIGVHYHTYSDIALITTMATRNLLFNRSKSYLKINWSENFRLLAKQDQAFGLKQRWGTLLSFYHERFKFPIYQNFVQQYEYTNYYTYADIKFYKLFGTTTMIGFGTSHEWLTLSPKISPTFTFKGSNDYWSSYFFFQRNSLDTKSFPRSGSYTDLQIGMIYGQRPDYNFVSDGLSFSSDTLNLDFHSYEQIKFKTGKYFPIHSRWTLIAQTNNGINLNYKPAYLNFYSVGGINDFIRNQIPFVGLSENQVNTGSISTVLMGIQFEPYTNFVTTFRANVGLYNYIDKSPAEWNKSNFLSGYAVSGGYRSAIGPIEISLIYSDQAKQFKGYVNLGFTF
jgi:NTE family protein